MGKSHARFSVAAWFGWSAATATVPVLAPVRMDLAEVLIGGVVAGATSQGWLSPDADGHAFLGKLIPGGHRGPLHCPDLVALLGVALVWVSWDSPARSSVIAVLVAWLGHLAGDWPFGGVPFAVTGSMSRRWGPTLDTDGWFERWIVRRALLGVALACGLVAVVAAQPWFTVEAVRSAAGR